MSYNKLMDFTTFAEFVKENICDYLDGDEQLTITLGNVVKNNGVNKTSLHIMRIDMVQSPMIYLEEFYDKYTNYEPLDDIMVHIADLYKSHRYHPYYDFTEQVLSDYDHFKDKIICRLINYKKNEEILREVPYIQILDMALTYRILFNQTEIGIATTLITHSMLESWEIEKEELFQVAAKNSERLFPPTIERMVDVMRGLMEDSISNPLELNLIIDRMKNEEDSDEMTMFVLSNTPKLNGAAVLFCSHALKEFANSLKKDIYILPSSIHEVILIPHFTGVDVNKLKGIVVEANSKVVLEDEILSDHIYVYSHSKDEISISA